MLYTDNSLKFWCLCYAFDGGAYQELSGADKKRYNLFVKVFNDNITNLPDNVKRIILSSAISQIGKVDIAEYESNIKVDIEKLRMLFRFK